MNLRREFEKFIEANLDNAYRFALSYTKNREIAEDVVSDSIEKALKNLKSLKKYESMKSWFFKIIVNTANSTLKKQSRLVPYNCEEYEKVEFYDDYSHINLQDILTKLPSDMHTIIILRYFEDLKISEISVILKMNENTVKTKLYKALDILRKESDSNHE